MASQSLSVGISAKRAVRRAAHTVGREQSRGPVAVDPSAVRASVRVARRRQAIFVDICVVTATAAFCVGAIIAGIVVLHSALVAR